MRRTWMFVALLVVVALAGDALAQQPKYVLRFSSPNSKEHAWGRGAEKFKQLVAEGTHGQVEVQIYHSNALGATRESLEMVRLGTVDFVLCGVAHLSRFVPEMGTLVLPYLWKDTETMFGPSTGAWARSSSPCSWRRASRSWAGGTTASATCRTTSARSALPEDLKGLKLRTLPTKVHIAFFRALGVSPVPMDWAEVYPALQQGVVDGQENPPGIVFFEKLPEVQKYYSLTQHVNEPGNVLMSAASWGKLPADVQTAIMTAARQAAAWERAESQRDNEEILKKLAATGMQVNTVAEPTLAEFRKVAHRIYTEAIPDLGPKGKQLVDLGVGLNK